MHRFFTEDIRGGTACVTGEDVRHIRRVLRMREGDPAEICDGMGTDYAGVIKSATDEEVLFALSEGRPSRGERRRRRHRPAGIGHRFRERREERDRRGPVRSPYR